MAYCGSRDGNAGLHHHQTETSQILDGLSLNLAQTFIVSRGWILKTLGTPCQNFPFIWWNFCTATRWLAHTCMVPGQFSTVPGFFCKHHHEADISGFEWNVSTTTGWMTLVSSSKYCIIKHHKTISLTVTLIGNISKIDFMDLTKSSNKCSNK